MNRNGKYNAKKTEVDGITFASKKEAARYQDLKLMEKAGEIHDLELQPRFDLVVNDIKIGFYKADFQYDVPFVGNDNIPAVRIIEDAKGIKTPVYRLKKKLMKAIYGIEIQEV